MALSGRKIRWAYSSDAGSTYTNFAGSISDSITFSRTFPESTDKDDVGEQDFIDEIATSSVSGSAELHFVNDDLYQAFLVSPTTQKHYLRLTIDGQMTATGRFVVTEIGAAGSEGDEPLKTNITIQSAGGVTVAAV